MPTTISIDRQPPVATVTLRRPEVHNAIDAVMTREVTEAFQQLGGEADVRVVVLAAEGRSFCAGADLAAMRAAVEQGFEQNLADALELGRMFYAIYTCPKPVVARVQGPAYGGGVGLVAACDLAVAVESARFCLSETKLGIIPGLISPYVLRKLGPVIGKRYFMTAELFNAGEARRIGLVTDVVPEDEALDAAVARRVEQFAANGPEAVAACKRLVEELYPTDWETVLPLVARRIAERRDSAEGREGVRAFLEKRPPAWRPGGEGV